MDVLTKYLSELSTAEVKLKILHAATGGITEGDVVLAEASNAIIIGFNVVADEHVAKLAEKKGVEIRFYNIIYRITEDLQKSMVGLLEPEEQEKTIGRAIVRTTFKVSKVGTIAGCYRQRRLRQKERQSSPDTRQYRHPRQYDHRITQALQKRRQRSKGRNWNAA